MSALKGLSTNSIGVFIPRLAGLGLLVVAIVSLAPLLFEPFPREPVAPYASAALSYTIKALCLPGLAAAIVVQSYVEGCAMRTIALVVLAGAMSTVHLVA